MEMSWEDRKHSVLIPVLFIQQSHTSFNPYEKSINRAPTASLLPCTKTSQTLENGQCSAGSYPHTHNELKTPHQPNTNFNPRNV